METFNLGGTTAISRIGLGTNRIDHDDASPTILRTALDLGVTFIDTADIYSAKASETVIGETVSHDPRAVIATKGGYHDAAPDKISAAIEDSRQRLQLDTIPLYYLHKPHPTIPIEQCVDPIVSAIQDGRVEHLGLSNVTLEQIDRVRKLAPVAAVQNIYNCEDSSNNDVIDYCADNDIAFVPFFPLRGSKKAQPIADRLGATRHQVVLAAMLKRAPNVIPIPGTKNPAHLESNLRAFDLEITDADLRLLGFQ